MTDRAMRKLRMRMKKVFKQASKMKKQHNRAIARYKKLQRMYRAA